jgi:hypothetical protein
VYAYVSSIAYGYLMTLWFWPFLYPGRLGGATALVRYSRFYLLTSLPWDTGRALLANVPLVVILARPLGRLLSRIRERFEAEIIVMDPSARSADAQRTY